MTSTPVFRNALPAGAMLQEYRIEQVLGVGGFGITYLARDTHLDKEVAIKEYLPGDIAMRAPDGNVVAQATEGEEGYKWGLDRFLLEARTLAKFSHPHIVRVLRYFEANATAYMVMDYEKGDSLRTSLQISPRPPEAILKGLLAPLLDGLAAVHAAGFLHRDIKPDNIFLRADGTPVLIDFGAARQAVGGSTKSLTAILTPGFAPIEQYSGEGKQGPWTDLYAMAGVLYRAVTDKNPPDAVARLRGDSLGAGLAEARGRYSEPFLRAIEWALALDEKQRPQSVAQWKDAILSERRKTAPVPRPPETERRVERTVRLAPAAPTPPPARSRWPVIAAVALLALAGLGFWKKHRDARIEAEQAAAQAEAGREREARARRLAEERRERREEKREEERQAVAAPASQADPQLERFLEKSRADYRAADADGDGALSRAEVAKHFPAIAREFERFDSNGDGRLSLEEFVAARRALYERRAQNRGG